MFEQFLINLYTSIFDFLIFRNNKKKLYHNYYFFFFNIYIMKYFKDLFLAIVLFFNQKKCYIIFIFIYIDI